LHASPKPLLLELPPNRERGEVSLQKKIPPFSIGLFPFLGTVNSSALHLRILFSLKDFLPPIGCRACVDLFYPLENVQPPSPFCPGLSRQSARRPVDIRTRMLLRCDSVFRFPSPPHQSSFFSLWILSLFAEKIADIRSVPIPPRAIEERRALSEGIQVGLRSPPSRPSFPKIFPLRFINVKL